MTTDKHSMDKKVAVESKPNMVDLLSDNQESKIKSMAELAMKISDEDFQKVCDEFTTDNPDPAIKNMFDKVKFYVSKNKKALELMRMLSIPVNGLNVSVADLYDALMDDKKFKEISSYLKNKVFW